MYRKHNPWLSLVALLLLALILVLTCTGCTVEVSQNGRRVILDEPEETKPAPRFTVEKARSEWRADLRALYIITDTETGAQYLFAAGNNGGGLCKLEG